MPATDGWTVLGTLTLTAEESAEGLLFDLK
jgi:hypothetical protein